MNSVPGGEWLNRSRTRDDPAQAIAKPIDQKEVNMKTTTFVGSLASAVRNTLILMAGITLLMTFTSSAFAQTNWVTSSSLPVDAIVGGYESPGGTLLYVCHGGQNEGFGLQPGKYSTVLGGCDFGYKGKEYDVPDFQYLVSSWQNASGGSLPSGLVNAKCPDQQNYICLDDYLLGPYEYYCRASIPGQSGLQPGRIGVRDTGCHVSFGGQELIETSYQVMVFTGPPLPLSLANGSGGSVPFDAVRGGTDIGGQPLYMCVANYLGQQFPGKVRQQFGACYIAYGGKEVAVNPYAVLVPQWGSYGQLEFPPPYGFTTGLETNGVQLFTCRGYLGGGIHPGAIAYDGTGCSFGWGGQEQIQYSGDDFLTTIYIP
jgi:hypothetical protein